MTTGLSLPAAGARIGATIGMLALILALARAVPVQAEWSEDQRPAEQLEWSLDQADGCPEVFLIGARGSGQSGADGGLLNMGTQVERSYRHFSKFVQNTPLTNGSLARAGPISVDYPAVPAITHLISPHEYEASVGAGRDDVVRKVRQITARCGVNSRFVLAGFSQGAHVVTEALWRLPAEHRGQVEAVVLIASPVYSPGEARVQLGGGDPSWRGALGPRRLPDWVRGRTADLCLEGDVICTSSGTGHATYAAGTLRAAGRWAGWWATHPLPAATPRCDGARASHVGTKGSDDIIGTDGRDVVAAKKGNDTVDGRGGADSICAGGGRDLVRGRGGNDRLFAGAGNDTVYGGRGDDALAGERGLDRCLGGPGSNAIDPSCELTD